MEDLVLGGEYFLNRHIGSSVRLNVYMKFLHLWCFVDKYLCLSLFSDFSEFHWKTSFARWFVDKPLPLEIICSLLIFRNVNEFNLLLHLPDAITIISLMAFFFYKSSTLDCHMIYEVWTQWLILNYSGRNILRFDKSVVYWLLTPHFIIR